MTVYIKFATLLFISLIIFCSCNNAPQASTPTQIQDSVVSKPSIAPIKFKINDPNDPPYIFQALAYQNQTKLFAFTLPDGQLISDADTLIQVQVNRKDGITQTLQLSATQDNCNLANYSADTTQGEATKWTTTTISNIVFNKGTVGLLSSFPIYTYTWQQNNYCFALVFKFETGIAFENEPPPPTFHIKAEEKNMQTILQSLTTNPN